MRKWRSRVSRPFWSGLRSGLGSGLRLGVGLGLPPYLDPARKCFLSPENEMYLVSPVEAEIKYVMQDRYLQGSVALCPALTSVVLQQLERLSYRAGADRLAWAPMICVCVRTWSCVNRHWLSFRYYVSVSCLLYTSPSPRDQRGSRMPSSA